eukprot:jgi/Orpsp1_1/1185532/evm.model.c7180000094277.1
MDCIFQTNNTSSISSSYFTRTITNNRRWCKSCLAGNLIYSLTIAFKALALKPVKITINGKLFSLLIISTVLTSIFSTDSKIALAFAPPKPKELMAARNGVFALPLSLTNGSFLSATRIPKSLTSIFGFNFSKAAVGTNCLLKSIKDVFNKPITPLKNSP